MSKYEVYLYDTYVKIVRVEAENPEDAIKKASELEHTVYPEFVDHDGEAVYELEEDGTNSGKLVLAT